MFTELPKLFDRDFALGYFLPAIAFVTANLALNYSLGLFPQAGLSGQSIVQQATGLGLVSLLLGILLLVSNFEVVRFLEGYGSWNPFHLMGWLERRRYKWLRERVDGAYEERQAVRATGDRAAIKEVIHRQDREREKFVLRFPPEEHLLPTAFGNTIRAFESYSLTMYRLDAIPGWTRLLTVIPADFRAFINAAKAQTDFWANLWFLGLILLLEVVGIAVWVVIDEGIAAAAREWRVLSVAALALFAIWVTSTRAASAAAAWGELVKTAFDVYLPDLRKKLGLAAPTLEQEQEMWAHVSQAAIFHEPDSVSDLEKWRPRPSPPAERGDRKPASEEPSVLDVLRALLRAVFGPHW